MSAVLSDVAGRRASIAGRGSRAYPYLIAFAMGLGFVAWLFPMARLFPAHPYDQAFSGDAAAVVIGQRYFVADAWRWPLLFVPRLAEPEGTNIALTDSVPLASLLLKILRAWLPRGAYALDLWAAFVCAVQPLAAVFALRSAGERRLVPAIAVAALALSLPTFLIRLPYHPSLASHFLLLLGIGLYYRLMSPFHRAWRAACAALLLGALLIQPYLLVMTAIVLFAAPVTLFLRGDRRWRREALALALACIPTAIAFVALGYGGTELPMDFGIFSMNLVAPIRPALSFLWPLAGLDPTGGQMLEGHQYLGAGLLLLCAAAVVAALRHAGGKPLRPNGLLVICAALTLFAVSSRVYAGNTLLLDLGPMPGLVRQFHASGRFFWPVAYIILVTAVATLGRRMPSRWLTPLLVMAVLLQFVDVTGLRAGMWVHERIVEPWTAPRAVLWPAMQAATRLTLWPTARCGASIMPDSPFMQILLMASQNALPVNTMHVSHVQQRAPCDEAAALASPLRAGELLIVLPPAGEEHIPLVPGYPQTCRRRPPFTLCANSPDLQKLM